MPANRKYAGQAVDAAATGADISLNWRASCPYGSGFFRSLSKGRL
jgi:hypothetical protein